MQEKGVPEANPRGNVSLEWWVPVEVWGQYVHEVQCIVRGRVKSWQSACKGREITLPTPDSQSPKVKPDQKK